MKIELTEEELKDLINIVWCWRDEYCVGDEGKEWTDKLEGYLKSDNEQKVNND